MYGQYIVSDAKQMMSLGVGQPAPYILEDAQQFISHPIEDHNVLQYGMKNGFEDYRKMVCDLMKTFMTDATFTPEPTDIYMTNGITQAIFMLGSLLKKYKYKTVYVEELTYFIIINIFKDLDFEIKSFNINDLEGLKDNLEKEDEHCLMYLIPFCNNPTGRTMSHEQTTEIVRIAQEFNILLLSDETYQFLHYSNHDLKPNSINFKPLATYSNKIISLGTFSKILVPGIRLGWIYSQKDILICGILTNLSQWLDNTGFMDSGGSVNPTVAYMVVKNLSSRFNQYKQFLSGVIEDLEKKSDLIINVLNKYSEYFEPVIPDGGYFVFVKSKKISSLQLLELAKECGINFHCGNKFTVLDNQSDTFRLSVSYYSLLDFENYFETRISNLVKLIDKYFDKSQLYPSVSLVGNGRLGKLIAGELYKSNTKYVQITREFDLTHINRFNHKSHVIIDVSSPEGTMKLIDSCHEKMIFPGLIIGTTGHTHEQMEKIIEYSNFAPIFYSSNFSQGIQSLIDIISGLTFVPKTIYITDIHHAEKKDTPSGTAKLLKTHLQNKFIETCINICSERLGNNVGTHIISFDMDGESIELTHKAFDRNIFAVGCIKLIEKLINKINNCENGFYSSKF